MHFSLISLLLLPLYTLSHLTEPQRLILAVPQTVPALSPSSKAILTTKGTTLQTPITRQNTFIFSNLTSPSTASTPTSYLLDIACRDYDFASYGVDIHPDGAMEIYRVSRGGIPFSSERTPVGSGPIEVKVLGARLVYETRAGFSPLTLLKNPMVLIGIVSLGFFMGVPYLLENMDPEMKAEFEEQQKKSLLSGGSNANPLQNFDMAAWMAGTTTGSSAGSGSGRRDEGDGAGGGGGRRRRG